MEEMESSDLYHNDEITRFAIYHFTVHPENPNLVKKLIAVHTDQKEYLREIMKLENELHEKKTLGTAKSNEYIYGSTMGPGFLKIDKEKPFLFKLISHKIKEDEINNSEIKLKSQRVLINKMLDSRDERFK